MGFNDFMHSEKGKVTTGILAAVLIATVVLVPVSIFADRAIRGSSNEENIKTFGYDDNKTSTGLRQDMWMGIDEATMINSAGEEITSYEARLSQNPDYTGVETDEALMDGVANEDGVAYLSNAWVSTRDELDPLAISTEVDEDGNPKFVEPGDDAYISAPLNMVMKVPEAVAEILKPAMMGVDDASYVELTPESFNGIKNDKKIILSDNETGGTIEDPAADETYDYGAWLVAKNYAQDFAMSVIIFNWVASSAQAHAALAGSDAAYSVPNENLYETTEDFDNWIKATFADEAWGVVDSDGNLALPSNHSLLVDGTGTDQAALQIAIDEFNKLHSVTVNQALNNGGSYRAWETSNDAVAGVTNNPDEYDGKNNGTANAFIGTQSRGMEVYSMVGDGTNVSKGEISYWGYDETLYEGEGFGSTTADDKENIIYNYTAFTDASVALPIATTIGGDNVVFFTTDDAQFEAADGTIYHPTGVTRLGYKMLFQFGTTWNELYELGQLQIEEVA